MKQARAFTIMELMIVITIAAILFVTSLPDGDTMKKEGVDQFRYKFEADLNYARSLSVADPSDPALIKMDPDANKYWVAKQGTPDTPVEHPIDRKPYVVELGSKANGALKRVMIVGTALDGDQVIKFDSLGAMDQIAPPIIRLRVGSTDFDVEISPLKNQAEVKSAIDAALNVSADGQLLSG